MSTKKDNVTRLFDVRPELVLQRLKRSTGLDFATPPENLAGMVVLEERPRTACPDGNPPILMDIVNEPVYKVEVRA